MTEAPPQSPPPAIDIAPEIRSDSEHLIDLRQEILYVDLSTEFDNEAMIARFAQELQLNLTVISADKQVDTKRLLTDDDYAASVLLGKLIDVYVGHGELVTNTTTDVVESLDVTVTSPAQDEIVPVQQSLTHPRFHRDSLGNPVIEIRVDGQVIEELIQNSSEGIVNLSLEVGTLSASLGARREVDPYIDYQVNNQTYYSLHHLAISDENGQSTLVQLFSNEDVTPQTETELESLLLAVSHWSQADLDFLISRAAISPENAYALSDGSYQNLRVVGDENQRVERVSEDTFRVHQNESLPVAEAIAQGWLINEDEYLAVSDEAITIEDDNTPNFRLSEAYSPQRASEALIELFAIAEAHPDKLFFAAAGNVDSFFYDALQQLAADGHTRPENLALVGVYFGETNTPTDGATFYLHREEGLYSASEATAAMSGIAAFLEAKGFLQSEIMPFMQHELMEDLPLMSPSGQELTVKVSMADIYDHLRTLIVIPKVNPQDATSYYFAAP